MKGKSCKCGFSTVGDKTRCPRCGKVATDAEWKDRGTVLSSARLKIVPNGFTVPMVLVLVEVDGDGPKLACWSEEDLPVGEKVALTGMSKGTYLCERLGPSG